MIHPTKQEKALVSQYLTKYVQTNNDITIGQYERLSKWLNGETLTQIAEREGVTYQAIQISVSVIFNKVKKFANDYHATS